MKAQIKTKSGRITLYGLACGYVETYEGVRMAMPSPSAGVIQVTVTRGDAWRLVYAGKSVRDARRSYDAALTMKAYQVTQSNGETLTVIASDAFDACKQGEGVGNMYCHSPKVAE